MVNQALGGWDYVVLGVTLLVSLSIGIYFRFTGGKQKTAEVRENNLQLPI